MTKLKNLATCKPSEFLTQTNKIRKSVEKWLNVTEIMEIRKHQPSLSDDMDDDARDNAMAEQGRKNLSDMLDSIMEKHPQETLELLALMSFVEPKDVDNHTVSEYLESFNEILNDQNVINFFISLVRAGRTVGLTE